MMTQSESRWAAQHGRDARFVGYLRGLVEREDRAALAALRRGLGKEPGTAPEMYPYVVPFLAADARPWEEMSYYLVAALFAWHQQDWPSDDRWHSNLGASLERFRRQQATERGTAPEDGDTGDSTERRFVAMLSSTREDLPYHLRQMVGLLRTQEVPINWRQLLSDIQQWNADTRIVQRSWAAAFWKQGAAAQPTDHTSEPTSTSNEDVSTGNNSVIS